MLAGLNTQLESLFPSIKGIVPDESVLEEGIARELSGRVVKLSGYNTAIFDMHSEEDRDKYSKCMLDLSNKVQNGTVRILMHDRQVMQRKDNSTGWFTYLEWMEYTRTDTTNSLKKGKRHGKQK